MAMDIGEGFLNEAKDDQFRILGKPAEVLRNAQVNLEAAALGETLHIPTEGFGEAVFVEKRRMQQIRHGTNFLTQLLDEFFGLLGVFGKLRAGAAGKGSYAHAKNREGLPRTIVELAGNVAALAILH